MALEGGLTAGGFGLGIGAAGHSLARVVGPWATEAAQRLTDRGIRLTPGQLLGPNAKRLEDIITSLPVINTMVRGRRDEALSGLNRVALDDALAPIGRQLAPGIEMGHDAVAAAGDEISAAYRRATPMLRGVWDINVQRDMANIANRLPRDQRNTFNSFVNHELDNVTNGRGTGAQIAGDDMQHLLQTLRAEANHLSASPGMSHHDRELGRAFQHAADAMHQNMQLHSPQAALDLRPSR